MRRLMPLVALVGLMFCMVDEANAQLFRRWIQPTAQSQPQQCYGPNCPQVTVMPPRVPFVEPRVVVTIPPTIASPKLPTAQEIQPVPLGLSDDQVLEMEDWGRTAARCIVGNSCGSASLCGFYNGGTLFLTNAHVTGTRPGTSATIRMVVDGETKEFSGRVIMAAYSDKTLTDWSVVMVEEKIPVEPRKLSIDRPTGSHTTVGAPRCVWPLARQNLRTVEVSDGSPLWRWNPNSIGGQSGSGVWSLDDGLQYGLLTWSWGGLGAGQQTAEIYRQARQRTVAGEPRPDGLQELKRTTEVIVENGFFAQAGIDELPIWDDGSGGEEPFSDLTDTLMAAVPAGADKCKIAESIDTNKYKSANQAQLITGVYSDFSAWPPLANAWFGYAASAEESLPELVEGLAHFKVTLCPPVSPDAPELDEDDLRLFQKLKDIRQARRSRGETAVDWLKVIELILKLIELFGANTSIESDDFAFDIRQVPVSEVELVMALAA